VTFAFPADEVYAVPDPVTLWSVEYVVAAMAASGSAKAIAATMRADAHLNSLLIFYPPFRLLFAGFRQRLYISSPDMLRHTPSNQDANIISYISLPRKGENHRGRKIALRILDGGPAPKVRRIYARRIDGLCL